MRNGYLTYILMAVNVIVFLMETMAGGSEKTSVAKRFGAMYSGMPARESWRYLTSMFVHFGGVHLICNIWALYCLGPGIEVIFGEKGFLLIYFVSGLAGGLLTQLLWKMKNRRGISAGASGAVFGLLGAYLVAAMYGFLTRTGIQNILLCIVINLVYGFLNRRINMTAHAGGFAGGFLTALAIALLV
ncbi:MAG: rhomboid family intramembrane serine protease [Chordicoccus sp.]